MRYTVAAPLYSSPLGSPLLLGQSLSDTRKGGGRPLPPPFLSLPLIGSRWRNFTLGALRKNAHAEKCSRGSQALFLRAEERAWLLTGGGEILCTDGYCHYHLPAVVHKMDPSIIAQQSDVRCKRGRLGVILIAPAAHTSKGLAKAFVSSAGGKGAGEPGYSGPLILRPEPRRCPLTCSGSRSKAQGLQLSALGYNVVTRP